MKRKLMTALLIGSMSATLLAGCGGSSSGASGSSAAGGEDVQTTSAATANVEDEDENTLSVYAWDANFNIPALKAAEKAYQQKNADFKLNLVEQAQSGDVENAMTLAGSSGDISTLPDIVLFQDHFIHKFVTDYPDLWQDVNDAEINWDDFGKEKLSYSTLDGKHFGVPVDNGTVITAYRTDLLEEAGYTIDDLTGCTWDEFDEIGKAVYEKTGKYLLCMDGSGNDLPYMMLQAEGESQFKDGKANLVGNEKFKRIVETIAKLQQDNVLYLANDWSDYTDQTIQGDMVAGVINGNWIIPTIEQVTDNSGKWEITSMPTLDGGEGYAANGGSSLYITAACTKRDLALDFLAYTFGGGEGASATYDEALKEGGVISTWIPASKSDIYNEGVDFFGGDSIYAKIVEMGANVPIVEQSDFHYPIRDQVSAAIQNIIGGSEVDSALQDAQEQIDFQMEDESAE